MDKEAVYPTFVISKKEALTKAAVAFVLVEDGPEDFEQAVRRAAQMTGIARVAIYRAHEGGRLLKRIYAYSRMGSGASAEDLTDLLGERTVYGWFKDEPESGNIVSYIQDGGEPDEIQEAFTFCVPIYSRGSFWGIVTLENMSRLRFETGGDLALKELAEAVADAYTRVNTGE